MIAWSFEGADSEGVVASLGDVDLPLDLRLGPQRPGIQLLVEPDCLHEIG